MMISDWQGALFDLHGVLADSSIYHEQAWHELADKLDIPFTDQVRAKIKGMNRQDALEEILKSAHRQREFTPAQKKSLGDEKNLLYKQKLERMTPADVLPGVSAFLAELQQCGIKMALASASENAPVEIYRLGLERDFPKIVDVNQIKHNKPAPDVYLEAAKMLDLPVSACIGFEDSVPGLKALRAAKVFAVGIGNPEELRLANAVCPATDDLSVPAIKHMLKTTAQ